MHWDDHDPPHFHVQYAEHEAAIEIDSLEVLRGRLPRRVLALTLEWAFAHRTELKEAWESCTMNAVPKKIPPLE